MSRRQIYTAEFKRQVILFFENSSNCAAQHEFDVNEKLIRGWWKQRDRLFACNGQRRAFRGPATGRHDALEKELRLHVEGECAKGFPVSCENIQMKAQQLAQRDRIDRPRGGAASCDRVGLSQNILDAFFNSVGAMMSEVKDVELRMAFFEQKGRLVSPADLSNEIKSHYISQVVQQCYVLILGLDVLGNPYGLVKDFTKGFGDFFYEPIVDAR
ncbi:hypothetical protein HPB50_018437 [Hyalomma asiaticum]|uniref:Uncharacterized protein n=1 Tax=Hyalomma asiaticum TaxID=266040 RepID=A0ACB7S1B1_HYAAI|nr:hypothetical protein HPB50_018437 [Hyalomma asiaticum]